MSFFEHDYFFLRDPTTAIIRLYYSRPICVASLSDYYALFNPLLHQETSEWSIQW